MVRQYEVTLYDRITETINQIEVFANNVYEAEERAKLINAKKLREDDPNRYIQNILNETKVFCIGIK
jgi:hypothetical protein